MKEFTLFNRNECPICNGSSKGCRKSNKTNLIFCREASASPADYIYRGDDAWGFGLWQAAEDAQSFSQQASEERQRSRQEFLQREQQRREQQRAQQLSVVERDRWYRKILERLNLSDTDRENLLNRGFTEEQIKRDAYKSVKAWQKVGWDLPPNLPGILANGSLNVHAEGILCPVINKDKLIVGCQVRLHDGSDGRYRWLTSATKKNPDGASPHLDNELPLGVFEPDEFLSDSIWLTEGTAIKPSLTRYKLGVPVVGAASGRFNGSSETAKAAIAYLSSKYRTNSLVFAIDAGDVINKSNVPERWLQQFEFFEKLGYQCRVAWWGQVSKDDDDIDELLDESIIDLITVQEFKNIVEEHRQGKQPEVNEETSESNNDWAWNSWLKSRKYTPDKRLNQEKFRFGSVPDSDAIIAAKSGLGTGKTEALIESINSSNRAAMIVGYRNNLLFQTISRAESVGLNIYHLREDNGRSLIADDSTSQAFCLDSIHHVDGYFKGRDVYLDETCSVLLHATNGGTLGENQAKAIKILTRALEECNRVILLDGNLADIHVDFIAKLAKNKQVVKLENQRKILPHSIKFIEGIDAEGEVKKRDKSSLVRLLCDDGVRPWIATDSKEFSKIIDKILKESGRFGFVLNAETAGEEWAKKFLNNPDNFILENRPQYFIVSPTAESGVSVTVNDYFTEKFTFFSGVLGTNSQHQIMFRLRDDSIPHYVFCPEQSLVRDRSNPKTYVTKAFQRILDERLLQSALLASQSSDSEETALEVIGKALARNNDDWWDFSCKLGALDNFEMDNYRRCLFHALREAGHNVETIQWEIDDESTKKVKIAKEAVQQEHAQELFAAVAFNSVEEAKEKAKSNPRKEVQRRIEKTFLLDRVPGIESNEVWTPEFILDRHLKDRDFITRQQRFYLLSNFEISQKRHEVDWYYRATNEDFFKASMKRSSHLTIWALQQLNPLQFLQGEWHKDSPEVVEFVEKARKPEIVNALRVQPGAPRVDGKERIEFLTNILIMLGLRRKSCGQRLVNGVKTRFYCVDQEALQNPDRLAVLEAVQYKFTQWMDSDKSKVCWDQEPVTVVATETVPQGNDMPVEPVTETVAEVMRSQTVDPVTTVEVTVEPAFVQEQHPQAEPVVMVEATEQTIRDVALLLEDFCDSETLAFYRQNYSPEILKAACKLVSPEARKRVKQWVSEQNAAATEAEQQVQPDLTETMQPQAFERVWGISRQQAQRWGAAFHWIKGGIVQIMYAARDYCRLQNGEFVNYSELAPVT